MRLIFSLAFLLGTLVMSASSQAAIVFTLTPTNQSVVQGTDAVFNVFIRSDTVSVNVNSFDLDLIARDSSDAAGNSGNFYAGTQNALYQPFSPGWDFAGGGTGSAFYQLNNFTVSNGSPVGTSDTLVGQIRLDTSLAALGNHTLSFLATNAAGENLPAGLGGLPIDTISTSVASFSITAVPEPTSMALVGLIGGVVGFRRWRKMSAKA